MKLFAWLWDLIPAQAQVWVAIAIILAAIGGVGLAVYKIDKMGYDRCEAKHTTAAATQKEVARGEIVDSGKKYEKVKDAVRNAPGPNDIAGPRVTTAIDSLPGDSGGQ